MDASSEVFIDVSEEGECEGVQGLAWSPDGRWLAAALATTRGTVSFVEPRSLQERRRLSDIPSAAVAISDNGMKMVVAGRGQVCCLDPQLGEARLLGALPQAKAIAMSSDGLKVAVGSKLDGVWLWDASAGSAQRRATGEDPIYCVRFSPDGTTLVAGGGSGTIYRWRIDSGARLDDLQGHTDLVLALVYSPIRPLLASASLDGTARLWDVATGVEVAVLTGPMGTQAALPCVAFSPDGKLIATAHAHTTTILWDVDTRQPFRVIEGMGIGSIDWTGMMAWSPDGRTLAVAYGSGLVYLYDVATGSIRTITFVQERDRVESIR